MIAWILRLMGPVPMLPDCSPEEIAQATYVAMERRRKIARARAARMAEYARRWAATERPPRPVVRFMREFGR